MAKYLDDTGLSYLWGKLKEKLAVKQDKLTGTQGQVVGFGADGLPVAQEKPTYTASEVGAAATSHVHAWSEVTGKPNTFTPAAHNQAASTITAGTFSATGVKAANGTDYDTARVRNIKASTTDLTAGSSALANGDIYLVYE